MINDDIKHKIKFGGCIAVLFLTGSTMANTLVNNNIPFIFAIGITLILLIFAIVAYLMLIIPNITEQEQEQENDFALYDKDSEILFED